MADSSQAHSPANPAPSGPPSRVRFAVVGVAIAMSFLLYLDRFCVSFAERYIREDMGLTETQIAWFLSAFFWSYALAQVPSGLATDRWGIRVTLTLYVLAWSLFTGFTSLATAFGMLLVMRLGFGLAQAGAYPAGARLVGHWVPMTHRATASSLVALGGRLGAAVAPILTAYLMILFVPLSVPAELDRVSLSARDAALLIYRIVKAVPAEQRSNPTATAANSQSADAAPKNLDEATDRVSRHVWSIWPASEREATLVLFQSTKTHEEEQDRLQKQAKEAKQPFTRDPLSIDDEAADKLRGTTNGLLRDAGFAKPELFKPFSLPHEAGRLLPDAARLSDLQRLRLNRLLLEVAYPDRVRKLYIHGWRPTLMAYGVLGIVVVVACWIVMRDQPHTHPGVNASELAIIRHGRELNPAPQTARAVPIVAILRSVTLWADSLTQVGTNIGWLFVVTTFGRYLTDVHNVAIESRAVMMSLPSWAGMIAMLFGGTLTDWYTRRVGLRWGRSVPVAVTRFIAAGCYVGAMTTSDAWLATLYISAATFFCDLGIAALWALKQDIGGPYVASLLGWGNMWGNLAAAVAPLIYVALLTPTPTPAHWHTLFTTCALAFVAAGCVSLLIDASKPFLPEEK